VRGALTVCRVSFGRAARVAHRRRRAAVGFGVSRETQRREEYERLYAKSVMARRAYEHARARNAELADLRRLREVVTSLHERLTAWQRAA
jgi:hypothetical protein